MSAPQQLAVDPTRKEDSFYRYKMPALVTKVEGKGNGIKTVMVNMEDIAQVLRRTPDHIMRYLGSELGAGQKHTDGKWILTGEHQRAALQEKVFSFICKFVLCKNCRNPETVFIVDKGRVKLGCKACNNPPGEVPPDEKLTAHILRELNAQQQAEAKQEKERLSKDEQLEQKYKEELAVQPAPRVAPVEAKERNTEGPVQALQSVIKSGCGVNDIINAVFDLKSQHGMQEKDLVKLVFRAYVCDPTTPCASVRESKEVMLRFSGKQQKNVVEEAEAFAHKHKDVVFVRYPMLLKELYDCDIVSDKAIVEWYSTGKSRGLEVEAAAELRRITKPLVDWMKQDLD